MTTPLAIIPAYVQQPNDVKLVADAVNSIHRTAGAPVDVLVVDDGSPAVDMLDSVDAEIHYKRDNTGFSSTVNVGLRRALDEGRDAFLINADMVMLSKGWVGKCIEQPELVGDGRAAVVGGLLIYPNGLIQHAGIYFSLLTRTFDHLYRYGPWNLREAHQVDVRPVTGAFQFIRHETLTAVGLYDETFKMGYEDVDFCIRVLLSGRECIYQPAIRAHHLESVFRGRSSDKVRAWHVESFLRLMTKYQSQSFAGLVPTI